VSIARPVHEVLEIYRYAQKHGQKKAAEHFKLTINQIKRIAKRYKELSDEIKDVAPKVRDTAISHAISKGYDRPTAEEFGSFCVEKYLTKMQVPYYKASLVDFFRERLGRDGNKTFERGAYVDPIHEDQKEDFFGFVSKTPHGLLVRLVFKYGFNQRELADMIGVNETRISHIVKKELENARRRMEADTRF